MYDRKHCLFLAEICIDRWIVELFAKCWFLFAFATGEICLAKFLVLLRNCFCHFLHLVFLGCLQPKWNNALLEMFRIDYMGNSPYINCFPSLYHHRLGPKDRFLILSSDGLYQYFTNEEAVSEVELFIMFQPEGDPAQHLVEEVLFRAAKKAGISQISTRNRLFIKKKKESIVSNF